MDKINEEIENNEVKVLDEQDMTQLKAKIEAVLFVTTRSNNKLV